jgi:outer membrane lipase/esterase
VALSLAAGALPALANSVPFNHLFVFGDSLSDTGNYYLLSGGDPPPPYYNGHFSNGPVWPEYLSNILGMEYCQQDNFAVAGACTGTFNINDEPGKVYPGVQDQISAYLALGPVNQPERALYVVAAGGNDVGLLMTGVSPAALIGNCVSNTVVAVQRLWAAGARNIMVMNLPDVGVTPMAQTLGPDGPATLTQFSIAYNQVLELALQNLSQAGIPTIRLNSFAVLDAMASSPATYGFTNVATAYLPAATGNPDQFLFWDWKHPTTGAHKVLAREAAVQLLNAFSPRNGCTTPDASFDGLKGLINSSLRRQSGQN